ncbi:HAMP domain-containing sensor histidine kinase [Roseateles sp. SL47]|uniref:sensor histidine kinase n=1 Tax=Roseateles sp. SL47 TaxID=2995138 RepID=UPI0022701079|nr:HAMP domain-containing sensor histidine kinase [Roseateles sp. SL47]WAC71017.1 HAMP domain-containing sensor histidine kinase [Roseateles sp. SL47]
MRGFLLNNRDELIQRCKDKVALRPSRGATREQLNHGIPLFLDQLARTLAAEEDGDGPGGMMISGPAGGDASALSEMGLSAAKHGHELLGLGYTVDQVVHDYGDLCQAITDLAVERDAPFSVEEFRTLNRCLDNAIADAVSEFAAQRDKQVARRQAQEENQRLGMLAHELRNYLHTATLAFSALESGKLPVSGSTAAVLKRSLDALGRLIDEALASVRETARSTLHPRQFSLADFLADAGLVAELYALDTGCTLTISEVDEGIALHGNRELLLAALGNLLQNAFKFTQPGTSITLNAHTDGDWTMIDVGDHCGGLGAGAANRLFEPFQQGFNDERGLGLGLSIAKRSVEADGGELSVQDLPGVGCIFTMAMPLHRLA